MYAPAPVLVTAVEPVVKTAVSVRISLHVVNATVFVVLTRNVDVTCPHGVMSPPSMPDASLDSALDRLTNDVWTVVEIALLVEVKVDREFTAVEAEALFCDAVDEEYPEITTPAPEPIGADPK